MIDDWRKLLSFFSAGEKRQILLLLLSTTVSGLVQVEVNASDDVGVTDVSLYANGQLVGTDGTAPYQFSWDSKGLADGAVTLSARAVDAQGNEGVSTHVALTVKNQATADMMAPSVTITKPADGSKVSGTVTVGW